MKLFVICILYLELYISPILSGRKGGGGGVVSGVYERVEFGNYGIFGVARSSRLEWRRLSLLRWEETEER